MTDLCTKATWPCCSYLSASSHQSLNREGRWGTADDLTTSFLHFSLFYTALWDLANSRPVQHCLFLTRQSLPVPEELLHIFSETILQGTLGGWATPWSAEEMLDGQHQRVDIPVHARAAHKGLLQKRLEEDLCSIIPHVPPTTQSVKRLN